MANQNPKDINTVNNITSIDANDYLFVSDQGSALRKANSNAVSKYAVETYNGTSLGGSNKTVQAAINDLNSNFAGSISRTVNSWADAIAVAKSADYRIVLIRINGTDSQNLPTGFSVHWGTIYCNAGETYGGAMLQSFSGDIYTKGLSAGNWGAWDKLPNSRTYSLSGGTQLQANVDLDTLLPGNYYAYNITAVQHGPFSNISGIVKVEHSAGTNDEYLRQTYRKYNNDIIYERIKEGDTWKDWRKLPARAEVDALNSKLGRFITSGSLHDILTPGIYYIGSSVTDQPVQQDGYGGTYIVSSVNENTLVGIYISMYDKSIWSITKLNATWTHTQMAKTAWKLVGTATGNNELSLISTNWNELRVIVYLTSTPNEGRVGYNITRQEIADTTGTPFYVNGRFPSSGGQAQIAVSGAYVKLDTYMVGTTNRVADATIRVYYR